MLTRVYTSLVLNVIESATLKCWIRGLRDQKSIARINARLRNASLGNLEDIRPVRGGLVEMNEGFTEWDATAHLRTREDMRLYLEACADEDPGDGSLIRAALNDIARAGNVAGLAREAGMSREGLYKALSRGGNPTFATVMRITRALGMQLRITV